MEFSFHAVQVITDPECRRVAFSEDEKTGEHYFLMDRQEDSNVPLADLGDVYIERDDQGWGGFGGIESVVLQPNALMVHLGERMANKLGGHETIRITFAISHSEQLQMRRVLGMIFKGYESRLSLPDLNEGCFT